MADTCEHWTSETGYAQASLYAACPWCELKRLQDENERLRKQLSERLQQVEEIRQASFTWALACPHNCEACEAMYEVIKGYAVHPTDSG